MLHKKLSNEGIADLTIDNGLLKKEVQRLRALCGEDNYNIESEQPNVFM